MFAIGEKAFQKAIFSHPAAKNQPDAQLLSEYRIVSCRVLNRTKIAEFFAPLFYKWYNVLFDA